MLILTVYGGTSMDIPQLRKLKPALKKGKRTKLVLRLELVSGTTRKTVEVKVTLRTR